MVKNENDHKWDIGICPNDTLVDFHKLQVVFQGWVDLENLIKFMDENETILLSRYVAAFEKGSRRLKSQKLSIWIEINLADTTWNAKAILFVL